MTKHFQNHSKHRSSALRTDRRLRTIAGRLVCELRRNLKGNSIYENLPMLFEQVLSQRVKSQSKIYSLNEPQVVCISKGKKHKKYEFVNKASIIRSANSIIQGT
ncbi:hypothetical protein J8L04_03230 [Bacteroides fragilis]|uniref:Uncharacterized protein n=1 Tax=Bacteroides fragilis TaxID=817 RepID=A0A0I9UQH8_BACFG|nr:hypothetical protein [Bacteroides fragilis]MCE8565044.1 hypothetical protein [Bacteroides fragilis]MCE8640979.1 hypothetical protein [Bacteroides fragilis]MCM0193550.1 hypothetical protein [Bacteroides fragilis]MCM0199111.1 hypothetical protein [Bacteroides fragilis]